MKTTAGTKIGKVALVAALGCLLSLVSLEVAEAQCSMCRTALEQNAPVAAGFNRGIIFLLATPYLVFGTLAGGYFWLRQRRAARGDGS